MIPLFLVYFGEYTINQSIVPVFSYSKDGFVHPNNILGVIQCKSILINLFFLKNKPIKLSSWCIYQSFIS